MTGLEKVTGKIIADAEADARALLAAAEADCAAARAASEQKTDEACEQLELRAGRECEELVRRAGSAAEMAKRNLISEVRSNLMEEVYRQAEREIRDLPTDRYAELLIKMLRGALRRQIEDEQEALRLYGEITTPEAYEILLNPRDRKTYGQRLLDEARNGGFAKVGLTDSDRLQLATETPDISGGLILRCGNTEINCSLSVMFADVRRATEGRVAGLLFGKQA